MYLDTSKHSSTCQLVSAIICSRSLLSSCCPILNCHSCTCTRCLAHAEVIFCQAFPGLQACPPLRLLVTTISFRNDSINAIFRKHCCRNAVKILTGIHIALLTVRWSWYIWVVLLLRLCQWFWLLARLDHWMCHVVTQSPTSILVAAKESYWTTLVLSYLFNVW